MKLTITTAQALLKNKNQLFLAAILLSLTLLTPCFSLAQQPDAQAQKDSEIIAIVGAKIVPVTGPVIESGSILIKNGRIADLGASISIPAGAKVIEAKGLTAYPGMIDSYSWLGLEEISGVRATVDNRETGRINPQVKAIEALRYDSMHIPIARANGIVAAVVAPSGGLISGQSTLVKLDGWTNREMVVKESLAMMIELPAIRRSRGGFSGFGRQQPQVTTEKTLDELRQVFKKARMYEKRREAARQNILLPLPDFDEASQSLLPVVKGELPVIFSVHADKDILQTIKFVQEEKIKAIFYGVEQGFKVAKEIFSPLMLKLMVGLIFSILAIMGGSIPVGKEGTLSTAFFTSDKTTSIFLPFTISTFINAEFSRETEVTRSMPTIPFKLSSIFNTMPSSISCGEAPG